MIDKPCWWQLKSQNFLNEALGWINSARSRDDAVDRCEDLRSDAQAFAVCESDCLRQSPGPDLIKPNRNRCVTEAATAAAVIENLFDILFDRPSQRLAVYGTLKPGGPNASQLADIEGRWYDGTVQGIIEQPEEYLEFTWSVLSEPVSVKIFSGLRLSEHFGRLDRFEGPHYRRSLVPVLIDGIINVCNIYEGKRRRGKS